MKPYSKVFLDLNGFGYEVKKRTPKAKITSVDVARIPIIASYTKNKSGHLIISTNIDKIIYLLVELRRELRNKK